jgi:hypothetical protein
MLIRNGDADKAASLVARTEEVGIYDMFNDA